MSHKYFISVDITFFGTNFSYHGLQLENNSFQSNIVPLHVVTNNVLSKTGKSLKVYQRKRLARDNETDPTQSLPLPNSSLVGYYSSIIWF